MKLQKVFALLLALSMVVCLLSMGVFAVGEEAPATEPLTTETPVPETPAPKTPVPETPVPETPIPETPSTDKLTTKAPAPAAPAVTEVTVKASDGTALLPVDGVITISGAGDYIAAGSGDTTISIAASDVNLKLTDLTITAPAGSSAITLAAGVTANLIVSGTCSLTGGDGGCGIKVPTGAAVSISGAGGQSGGDALSAIGTGTHACGIGDYLKDKNSTGQISIRDLASLTAQGGFYDKEVNNQNGPEGGPAIGDGVIVIEDCGSVTAQGGSKAAAIGSGFLHPCDVTITRCGSVNATGGATAAAIGTSRNNYEEGSRVTITDSSVTAKGGYYGAAIGTGYYDKSYGDYSRVADPSIPPISITLSGSAVRATGGKLAAAIGGGYKSWGANITIDGGSTVTAYAGQNDGNGQKIPCAIGSGADGSGIFTDKTGSVSIAAGADVMAFSYGYEFTPLASKWAISRELQDSSTAAVLNCRFLTGDAFTESGKYDAFAALSPAQENTVTLTGPDGAKRTVTVPAGYTTMAATVTPGTYTLALNGQNWSYLPAESYSAVTDGKVTGTASLVYGTENAAAGSYADYETSYQPYGAKSDTVTLHYAFGTPSADFALKAGVNNFDAVAYRAKVNPTPVPTPTPTPVDPGPVNPNPTPTPTPTEPNIPDPEVPTTELPGEDVPKAADPARQVTGDNDLAVIGGVCAVLSLGGLVYVLVDGKKKHN